MGERRRDQRDFRSTVVSSQSETARIARQKKRGRGVPDIAMSATGYFTRVDTTESATGGGTSAVAPLMAALVARLNQAKKKNVGFLNPFLYANVRKGVVHDVTSGTNAIKDTIKGYRAGPGWMRALASEHQMELPS